MLCEGTPRAAAGRGVHSFFRVEPAKVTPPADSARSREPAGVPENRADRELVARCIGGAPGAWEEFQERYRRPIAAMVGRAARQGSTAPTADLVEEVAAEVLFRLLDDDRRLLRTYRGEARLSTWLCTIAWRLAREELRARGRLGTTGSGAGERSLAERPVSDAAAGDPAAASAERELEARLARELGELSPRDRLILVLFHEDGRSYREIAAFLGIPEANVGRVLARARDRLRERLERPAGG